MKHIQLIAILSLTLLFLAACSTQPETKNEDLVNSIEFDYDSDTIIVDTDRIVIATDTYKVEFMETDGDEFIVRENNNTTQWIFESFWKYTVFVPSDQIKELSRQYAETFNETLPIEQPESED